MDAAVIIILGLFFCLRSAKAPDNIDLTLEEQSHCQVETKLNETFYEDTHAFEVVANGLNFYS